MSYASEVKKELTNLTVHRENAKAVSEKFSSDKYHQVSSLEAVDSLRLEKSFQVYNKELYVYVPRYFTLETTWSNFLEACLKHIVLFPARLMCLKQLLAFSTSTS